jgi:hypothetical protein
VSETLSLTRARSLWWERQGLGDNSIAEDIARAIGITGWLRTLGGADVYIAARARAPGMTRAQLDAAVVAGDLRVVPAVRGCIYLVPSRVVADLMALNAPTWRKNTEKDLAKANAKLSTVETVADAVLDVLTTPLTPDAIRKALPKDSIPSFGEAGKKVGLSSPLPLALRLLEFDGRIERTLDGGRLDSERYLWRKAQWKVPKASANPLQTVIAAFLDSAGPSTLAHLSDWSGSAQRDLKPILDALGAEAVTIEGVGDAFAQKNDVDCAHEAPLPLGTRCLAFEDNYLVNHGGPSVVTDPRHHAIEADIWGSGKPEAIGKAGHVLSRTIVHDGVVVGFWEVDVDAGCGVWATFEPQKPAVKAAIEDAVQDTAKFLLDDVKNPRVFSLDTIELVQERAERIKKIAGVKPKKAIAAKQVKKKPAAKKPAGKKPAGKKKPAKKKPAKKTR